MQGLGSRSSRCLGLKVQDLGLRDLGVLDFGS